MPIFRATVTLLLAAALSASLPALAEPYKVGVIVPLSGDAAGLGGYLKNGVELGMASLPATVRQGIEVAFEDDQLQSAKSISAFQKLRAEDGIKAVLVISSGIGHAVAPLAEQTGTVMIAVAASDKNVAAGRRYVFTHWVNPEAEARLLVAEIGRRNYRHLAVVTSEQQGAIALENALNSSLREAHLDNRVVYSDRFSPDMKDFRTSLARIRSAQADGIISILLPGNLSAFAKQVRDLKMPADFFGFELFEDEHEVKASDGALIGKWYVNAGAASDEFKKSYVARYHEQPGVGASNGFDAIRLIAHAAAETGGDNGKIAEFLRTLKDYSGAAGHYSATGDNRFDIPAELKIVTRNGFERLDVK